MDGEVVVKVEGDEGATAAAEETTNVVIEAAVEIAEKIDAARQEEAASTDEIREVKYSLDDVWGQLNSLVAAVGVLTDLVMGVSDQVAALSAIEVAEIVVENTPKEVDEIAAVADVVETAQEEPVVATTPEIRQTKKRHFI